MWIREEVQEVPRHQRLVTQTIPAKKHKGTGMNFGAFCFSLWLNLLV